MKTLIASFACALVAMASAVAGETPNISIADLAKAIMGKNVTILDVNGTQSFKRDHIPGAINYSAVKNLAAVPPTNKGALVVAYGANKTDNTYTVAAEAAESLGYTNVKYLSVGINGWIADGQKTESGSGVQP